MFKALGAKVGMGKAPPNEGLIEKHRSQKVTYNQWKNDVTSLKGISIKLAKSYQGAKNNFAMNRYEDLKDMIKLAVAEFKKVEHDIKTRPVTKATNVRNQDGQTQQPAAKKGLMAQLRHNAQNFAEIQGEAAKQEKDYAAMTTKEVEAEMEEMRKSVIQLKQEFYAERDKLSKLSTDYEESKKLNPSQRYAELKKIIKAVIRT